MCVCVFVCVCVCVLGKKSFKRKIQEKIMVGRLFKIGKVCKRNSNVNAGIRIFKVFISIFFYEISFYLYKKKVALKIVK